LVSDGIAIGSPPATVLEQPAQPVFDPEEKILDCPTPTSPSLAGKHAGTR
jgi:hypothetical protein